VRLRSDRRAPGGARDALRRFPGLDDDVRATAALLLSELVTNAVRHSGAEEHDVIEVGFSATGALHVDVIDRGPGILRRVADGRADEDGGRGLMIVALLASRWGADRGAPSRVWFELDLAPGDSSGPAPGATRTVQPGGG
jgi:two-component sensor histidine kinase